VNDPNYQQHDFEPGIADNGLFWTIPIGNGTADADPATGAARFRGQSVKVTDYHDIVNAIFGGGPAPVPSRVSFDVRWAGGGATTPVRDATFGFVGAYVTGPATVSFTAFNEHGDVMYTSDPDLTKQSNPGPPGVGTERNGVFFS
jgi:hypothetical protein